LGGSENVGGKFNFPTYATFPYNKSKSGFGMYATNLNDYIFLFANLNYLHFSTLGAIYC